MQRSTLQRAVAVPRLAKARRLHRRAIHRWNRGATGRATRLAQRSRALYLQHPDADATELLAVLSTLAGFASAVTDLEGASCWQRESVQRARTRLPAGEDRDAWLLEALTGLGNTLRLMARYEEAADVLAAAEDVAGRPGVATVRRAGCVNAQGILAKDTGDHAAAAAHYQHALRLLEAEWAPDAAELAALHHNLAGLAHARGDYVAAEEPARRALDLRRRAACPDSDGIASDLAVLGAVLVGQGRLEDAARLFHEALEHWRSRYGPDHYEVATNLHHLAMIHMAQGRPDRARAELRTALSITRRVLGEQHPEVRTLRTALAESP